MSSSPMSARAAAIFAASAIVIAACAPARAPQVVEVTKEVVVTAAPAAGAIDPNAKFQLTYLNACFPSSVAVTDLMVAAFGAKYPNVDVKVDCAQGDYAEGIFAQAAAGNLPDIMLSADLFTVPFVNAGVLLDLEQFDKADDSFSFDDIYPNILALGQVPGKAGTYMIPASWDSVQMYYNKDMFEKAGAGTPTDEWTWDDLVTACKIVQEKTPDVYCVGNGGTEGWDWWAYFIPFIVGHGGYPVSEDFKTSTFSSPESLKGIQAYVDQWTAHKITIPIGEQLPSGRDGCFIAGKCATYFSIPGLMKTFRDKITDFKWDVVQMPALPAKRVTGMGTYGYGISKDSKNPQAAWEFIKFLASPTGQRLSLSNYIGVPFLKSMAEDPVYERLQAPPENVKAFLKGGEIGIFPPNGYPPKCGSLYAGLINQTVRTALEESIRGAKTVEQAFKDADAEIQSCLDTAG